MATSEIQITLPPLNLQTMDITVVGESPLICHAWSAKAKKAMLDKQMKKATRGREAKNPEKDFAESLYPMPDGNGYGFPIIAFKNAAVTACTSIAGVTKTAARQAFRVGSTLDGEELVRIESADPEPREDMVRIGQGTSDIRYRGMFKKWRATIRVKFNASVLSAEQIVNLFNVAGFGVGVGEWRMEKDGQFGCFHVATSEEVSC